MRLVEEDEAVVGDECGLDRGGIGRDAITAEKQPRAELIDRRADDGGLRGGASPAVVAIDSAAELEDVERRGAVVIRRPRELRSAAATSERTGASEAWSRSASQSRFAMRCARWYASSTITRRFTQKKIRRGAVRSATFRPA